MIVITIKTGNAAFEDDLHGEVARILHELANKIENGCSINDISLMDINGNNVGKVEVK